jgi:hypothetical protein
MVNRPRKKKQKNERCNKEESNRNRMRLLKMKRATIRKKKMFGRHTRATALSYDRSCCWGILYGAVVAAAFRERKICVSWYRWEEQKMSKGENGSEDDVVGRETCCAAARLLTHLGGNHQRRGMDVE